MALLNAITVDVEDYFHTEAMTPAVSRDQWSNMPLRVERNTERLFECFAGLRVHATFFFLGWVAERCPQLVRRAVELGHEVACHSYWHRAVFRLSPDEFRQDTLRAKSILEDHAQVQVLGYRAPSFSITKQAFWALDILRDLGFRYDTSINPVRHDFYSNHDAPRHPYWVADGSLLELPIATWPVFGTNVPVGGGAYLRVLPLATFRRGLRYMNEVEGAPAMLYLHPWEIDPEQPRLRVPLKSRLRQYTNLSGMLPRLRKLLQIFPAGRVIDAYAAELARPAKPAALSSAACGSPATVSGLSPQQAN